MWLAVTRCSRAGRMDTARAFIALLTFGAWGRLLTENRIRKLSNSESIHELHDEDRNSVALLFVVCGWHFRCFTTAPRRSLAKNGVIPVKNREFVGLTVAAVCNRRPLKMFGAHRAATVLELLHAKELSVPRVVSIAGPATEPEPDKIPPAQDRQWRRQAAL